MVLPAVSSPKAPSISNTISSGRNQRHQAKQSFRRSWHPHSAGGHRMPSDPESVTRLLREWNSGNKSALDELMPVVYDQLHRLAAKCMASEDTDHTLRATALVNEAYLRLVDVDIEWENRVHFFALAARMLRRILVDHARANQRGKRGGGAE